MSSRCAPSSRRPCTTSSTRSCIAEAADLIADHKLRGHDVVVVSASGEEVVAPIAQALGATHYSATRMAVEDGKFTGDLDFYCYGEGKVQAIRELAEANNYDLALCYAYSDSATDLPMLGAVGHPTAVNPDRALRKEAAGNGWPILTFSNPVPLRARIQTPSGTAVATTAAVSSGRPARGRIDVQGIAPTALTTGPRHWGRSSRFAP